MRDATNFEESSEREKYFNQFKPANIEKIIYRFKYVTKTNYQCDIAMSNI